MESKKYTRLGIYERGDIIVGNTNEAIMLDCTYDVALIRKLPKQPLGYMSFGLAVYDAGSVDYDHGDINRVDTWKSIIENKLLENGVGYEELSPLAWLLESKFRINEEVYDYLYSQYPEEDLTDILRSVNTFKAGKWAYDHGASKNPSLYKITLEEWLRDSNSKELKELYTYIFESDGKQSE